MNNQSEQKACTIYLNRSKNGVDEMDMNYEIIEEKVKELNELGIDITLQELGNIIESKFVGKPNKASLIRWEEGERKGKLLYPHYTLVRP